MPENLSDLCVWPRRALIFYSLDTCILSFVSISSVSLTHSSTIERRLRDRNQDRRNDCLAALDDRSSGSLIRVDRLLTWANLACAISALNFSGWSMHQGVPSTDRTNSSLIFCLVVHGQKPLELFWSWIHPLKCSSENLKSELGSQKMLETFCPRPQFQRIIARSFYLELTTFYRISSRFQPDRHFNTHRHQYQKEPIWIPHPPSLSPM